MKLLEFLKNRLIHKWRYSENLPYSYDFYMNLKEKDYPYYLKQYYKQRTGRKLNLKNPITFNEKIQWLKLYDNTPLKTRLTDKVLVRDWVKEKIGEEYLKPVFQICKNFDSINFDDLPQSFFMKANHGCKWNIGIADKNKFLENEKVFHRVRVQFDDWMNRSFFPYAGFELQYKGIVPQIIIEKTMLDDFKKPPVEYEIFCFNAKPKFFQKVIYPPNHEIITCVYDENFEETELAFNLSFIRKSEPAGENIKIAAELSKKLCKDFKLVRVDWMEYKNKLYFNEMTFTPMSGFFGYADENWEKWNKYLGNMLKTDT